MTLDDETRDILDARVLRELLGAEPLGRMTRLHAHGALLDRATSAAWRLACGGPVAAQSRSDCDKEST